MHASRAPHAGQCRCLHGRRGVMTHLRGVVANVHERCHHNLIIHRNLRNGVWVRVGSREEVR